MQIVELTIKRPHGEIETAEIESGDRRYQMAKAIARGETAVLKRANASMAKAGKGEIVSAQIVGEDHEAKAFGRWMSAKADLEDARRNAQDAEDGSNGFAHIMRAEQELEAAKAAYLEAYGQDGKSLVAYRELGRAQSEGTPEKEIG